MEIEIKQSNEKLGEDKKKLLYPGSRLFILKGGKVGGGPDVLKNSPKFISYDEIRVNEAKEKKIEGGDVAIVINGSIQIGGNTVIVTPDTKFEQKEGQQKIFITGNEKIAKEVSRNTNIIERQRLVSIKNHVDAMIEFLDDIIEADSNGLL